ncbi:MAG: hypothetical protein AB1656_23965 [Candidatus Omnitrophota bacterium]
MNRWMVILVALGLTAPAAFASNKAGIVIQNSTGEIITRCVEFEEASLTLKELLQRSGFKMIVNTSDSGERLCFLHDDGRSDCSMIPGGLAWRTYRRESNDWTLVSDDISTVITVPGSLIGFVCGPSGVAPTYEKKPPALDFAAVCETVSKAALVIDHSDGERVIKIVEFPGETITGWQLLLKSGLQLVYAEYSFGAAVCTIDGEGQSAGECFNDPFGRYWDLNILDDDDVWSASFVGASDVIVRNHDVNGWLFGTWGATQFPIRRNELFPTTAIRHSEVLMLIWMEADNDSIISR